MNVQLLLFIWFIIIALVISIIHNNVIDFDFFDNDNDSHLNINNILNIQDSQYHNIFQNQVWINDMNKNGAIVIPNILSNSDCDSILDIISNEKNDSNHFYEDIRSNENREYIMLPLENTIPFVKKIYTKIKYFCDILLPNPKLLETSAFITYKGCLQQRFHCDGNYKNNQKVFTFGIALDDITEDMGPLEFYMGSHYISNHKDMMQAITKYKLPPDPYTSDDERNDDPLDGYKYNIYEQVCESRNLIKKKCTCKKGSLVIWSWNVIHRGTENNNKIRPVFYFSIKNGTLKFIDGIRHNFEKKNNLTYILSEYQKEYDLTISN